MANNKLSDGVGKKIVEALKKQSEIEINPIPSAKAPEEEMFEGADFDALSAESEQIQDANAEENGFLSGLTAENDLDSFVNVMESSPLKQTSPVMPESTYSQQVPSAQDSFVNELDKFEIPSNIAVLKKLITQLPSGVTRHTGAQIIRQTMEALGISMKSVLQEAQQLQDSLNSSAKECQNTIQEYKKHIITLEKQAQNHQRQYAALNELVSLFIQTNSR